MERHTCQVHLVEKYARVQTLCFSTIGGTEFSCNPRWTDMLDFRGFRCCSRGGRPYQSPVVKYASYKVGQRLPNGALTIDHYKDILLHNTASTGSCYHIRIIQLA